MTVVRARPTVLVIMDWGYRDDPDANAVAAASTPVRDQLWNRCPHTLLTTSGSAVGLPSGKADCRDREVRPCDLFPQRRRGGSPRGRGAHSGALPRGRNLRSASADECPGGYRRADHGDTKRQVRRGRRQLCQPGHGRPYWGFRARREGDRNGGSVPGPADNGIAGGGRGDVGDRRPRQRGTHARSQDGATAHRPHVQSRSTGLCRRARSDPRARQRRPVRCGPDPARHDGVTAAGRDDRQVPVAPSPTNTMGLPC
jgi:hypothetical protein